MHRYSMSTVAEGSVWHDAANTDGNHSPANGHTNANDNNRINQQPFSNPISESGSSRSDVPLNNNIPGLQPPSVGIFQLNNNNYNPNLNTNFGANLSTTSCMNHADNTTNNNNTNNTTAKSTDGESSESQYRQFVTTLLDSSTNQLVQLTSQPPPDYVAVKKRRNRISISCMSCKRRKVKCDRDRPICGSCKKHGHTVCIYSINENENDQNKIRKHDSISDSNENAINNNAFTQVKLPTPIGSSKDSSTTIAITNSNHNNEYQQKMESDCQYSEFNNLLNALDKLKLTHVNNDEINQLRKKVEHLRFYLDDKSILKSKILRNLNSIETFNLIPVLETNSNVSIDSFNLQFGASSLTSYVEVDHYMGTIFKKTLPKIKNDILQWKSYFSVDIYRSALEKLILGFEKIDDNLNLNEIKVYKFKFICKLLEDYFINFKIFRGLMNNSIRIMSVAVPVIPVRLLEELISEHFICDEHGDLKIIKNDTTEEFSEILLILTILRFGLSKSENVINTPDEINFKTMLNQENILTDNKTDLLNSFLKIILKETDLTQTYNIPMLGTLILFFMISYTHRFNFKSDNTHVGLNYGILAVYMAVHLGFYSKNLPTDTNNETNKYLKEFSIDDFHNVWNLIMFIDTFSSFNSSIPQLISSNMDTIYITNFVDLNCANICHFYRKTFKLANKNNNLDNDVGVSIIQYERFVIEFESFIVNKLEPTSVCIIKNDLVGVATSIRALNLLLFLYYNGYFSFLKTIETYKENNKNNNINPEIISEFDVLEKRLFERCIKLSIVSLIDLNVILVQLFSEKDESFYEKYSFDLIQIFIRIIYTSTSCICKMLATNDRRPPTKDFNFLFDITREQSENLSNFFVAKQCSDLKIDEIGADIVGLLESVDELSTNPSAMIKLLVGFFFNTSRSLISQDFIYYALYKYFVMAVIQFADHPGNPEDFDIDRFDSTFSHVDCTWFINK